MPAQAPSRKSSQFNIGIGLITITLDKFSATEESSVKKSQYRRVDDGKGGTELHPVGMTAYDKINGENVDRGDIIKMVEANDGTLVEVSEDELTAFHADNESEFIGFISRADFDANYITEKAYQVRPSRPKAAKGSKSKPAGNPTAKVFGLFLDGMRSQDSVMLVKLTERGNPRNYAILPDGTMFSLLYDEEVRESLPLPVAEGSEGEVKLVNDLIQKMTLDELPVLTDTTSEAIYDFVEQKRAAMEKGEEMVMPEAKVAAIVDDSQDLMSLLAASLGS